MYTDHKVPDDHCKKEEGDTRVASDSHTAPHGLDPLSTQHTEYYHEGMKEIIEVPSGHATTNVRLVCVSLVRIPEQLLPHDGEDEDDDAEDDGQVTQSSHSPAHDSDQHVQRRPGFGKLENSELKKKSLLFYGKYDIFPEKRIRKWIIIFIVKDVCILSSPHRTKYLQRNLIA